MKSPQQARMPDSTNESKEGSVKSKGSADPNPEGSVQSVKSSQTDKKLEIDEKKFKFRNTKVSDSLKELVMKTYNKNSSLETLPSIVAAIKKDMDTALPRGWIVFAGKHMTGSCSFIEATMVDVEIDGISFVIFQTFCPNWEVEKDKGQ